MRTAAAVIDRMREALEVRSDTALAAALGVAKTTVSSWRRRDSIPYEKCIEIAIRANVHMHWLLTGEGEPRNRDFVLDTARIDPEKLAIAIELAQRHPGVPDDDVARLSHYISSYYTQVTTQYNSFAAGGRSKNDDIIISLRRIFGLRHAVDFLTWWEDGPSPTERARQQKADLLGAFTEIAADRPPFPSGGSEGQQ